jgi:hypothetical protein
LIHERRQITVVATRNKRVLRLKLLEVEFKSRAKDNGFALVFPK